MGCFPEAVKFVLTQEGGATVSDNPNDSGSLTKYGISIVFAGSIHLDLDGDGKTTRADILALDEAHAIAVYKQYFWDPLSLDQFAPTIACVVFDQAVNQGPAAAIRDLQMALGIQADGKLGPATMGAIKACNAPETLSKLIAYRGLRYTSTKNFGIFGKGWINRLMASALFASAYLKNN